MSDAMESQIKDAVRMALVEEKLADHEGRIATLERFRWWLISTVAVGAIGSIGSLALLLAEKHI